VASIKLIIVLLLALAAGPVRAQAVLDGHSDRVDLWPHVRVLWDPTASITFEQALASPQKFAAPQGAYASLGLNNDVLWVRVPISVAAGGEGDWILDLDYALMRRVEVAVVVDGQVVHQVVLGDDLAAIARPLPGRSHAAPLDFKAGTSAELVLRIDKVGGKILPLTLSRLPAFLGRALDEHLLQGMFIALGIFLLLYSLTQWVALRDNLYLKYAFLVFCSVMFSVHFTGIGEMYLWTDMHWLQHHLAGITSVLAAAATALFVADALAGDLNLWLRRGLYAVAIIHVALTVAYSADVVDIKVVSIFMSTTGLAPALMGMPGAYAKARRGDTVGIWFMAAWLGYFVSSMILVGVVTGRLGATYWTLHSFQIGTTVDMLIFMRIIVLRTAAIHHAAERATKERDQLHSLAHSDPLTGLLNRRGLDGLLPEALAKAGPERMLALYMLDLDGLKPVNDKYGHDVGDTLLQTVAQRLRGSMRAGDLVARLGGDEFVVAAGGLANEKLATDLGTKLLEALRAPFNLHQITCNVSATIGYAMAPADAIDGGALLKAADAAMYAGKQQGKDRLVRA
jgi:diguanylate cyclase (GGDEF)-like protein